MIDLLINNRPVGTTTITEWQEVELHAVPPLGCTLLLTIGATGDAPLAPFLRPDDPTWRWRWNPQNAVGRFPVRLQVTWPDGSTEELRTALDVIPRKLDQRHYDLLLDDLQQAAYTLVYTLVGGTVGASPRVAPGEWERSLLADYFSLFGERFAALERAVERIASQPHTLLRTTSERVPTGQARNFSRLDADLSWSLMAFPADQEPGAASTGADLPAEITQPRSTPTADTYENRLLKRLLNELYQRARHVNALATQETGHPRNATGRPAGAALREIAEQSRAIMRRLQELRSLPFLAEVGPLSRFYGPSQVMQRNPAYRQVYRFWQDLRRHPFIAIESPLFQIPLHELPYLYECWCAIQLVFSLLALPDALLQTQSLVSSKSGLQPEQRSTRPPTTSLYTLTLTEAEPLLVLTWRGMTLRLRYQPCYRPVTSRRSAVNAEDPTRHSPLANLISLDRHTRIPDFVLEIAQPDQPLFIAVLDAKYRLDASGGVPEDALADAYTYLGSIGTPDGERVTRAALLLYPGTGPAEHYPSGVGALPLLPGATAALQAWLEQLGTITA